MHKFSKPLTIYKLKDFEEVLKNEGYYFHHQRATHRIYANKEYKYVTVPIGKHGEVNGMMSTVTLQRIKNNQCRVLDKNTIQKYSSQFKLS